MKKLLIGLLIFGSISTFAEEDIFLESFKLPSKTTKIQVLQCQIDVLRHGGIRHSELITRSLNRFLFNGTDTLVRLHNREDEGATRIKFKSNGIDVVVEDFKIKSIKLNKILDTDNFTQITPEGEHIVKNKDVTISCKLSELKTDRLSLKGAYKFQAKKDFEVEFKHPGGSGNGTSIFLGQSSFPTIWSTDRCDIYSHQNYGDSYIAATGLSFIQKGYNFFISAYLSPKGYQGGIRPDPTIRAGLYSKGMGSTYFSCRKDAKPYPFGEQHNYGYETRVMLKNKYPSFPMNTFYKLTTDYLDLIF